jgi:hypothetical protein
MFFFKCENLGLSTKKPEFLNSKKIPFLAFCTRYSRREKNFKNTFCTWYKIVRIPVGQLAKKNNSKIFDDNLCTNRKPLSS